MKKLRNIIGWIRFILALTGCAGAHDYDQVDTTEETGAPKTAFAKPYDDEPAVLEQPDAGSMPHMPTTPEADALPATATLLTADAGTPVSATPDAGSVVPAEPKADAGAPAQDPAKLWYEGKTVEVTIATTVLKAVQTPLPSTIWCSNPYAANGLAVQRWSFARSGDGVTLVRPGFPDQKSREYRNGRFWFWDVAADGSQFSVALDSQSGFAVDYQANAKAPEQDSLLGYTCGFTTFAVAGRWL